MKVKTTVDAQNEKKVPDKENKPKVNQWDMFAEQDIFKADTSVSVVLVYCSNLSVTWF